MKAKFEEFNDGTVEIYNVNDDDKLEKAIPDGLRFGEENVGITRHYAARAADSRVDKVIHVLLNKSIQPHEVAVIDGEQYDIDKVDHIKDNMPPISKLTLIAYEKHRKKEFV